MAGKTGLAKQHKIHATAELLTKQTHFSSDECKNLLLFHERMIVIGNLDRLRFREILHVTFSITDDVMLDLVFHAFDRDGDGIVFTATAALAGASQISSSYRNLDGKVVNNEILRTNRRIFSGSGSGGGWGNGGGDSAAYRPGPPSLDNSGFLNLFNAMSGFGLSSSYGAPAGGGSSGGGGGRPSSQYGPPGSGGSGGGRPSGSGGGRPPSSQYGPPGSGSSGNGGGRPSSQYGPPAGGSGAANANAGALPVVSTRSRGNGGGAGGRGATGSGGGAGIGADGGRIFRYVSLFTAPEEPAQKKKVVQAGPSVPDKHVNIIFVKPPTPAAEQPTEVLLAPEPERKTIVYVLMKKPTEGQETVRVRPAPPTQPSKPEVYFIPYKDPNGNGQQGSGEEHNGPGGNQDGEGPGGYGGPSGDLNAPGPDQGPSGGYGPSAASGPSGGGPSGGYSGGGPGGAIVLSGLSGYE